MKKYEKRCDAFYAFVVAFMAASFVTALTLAIILQPVNMRSHKVEKADCKQTLWGTYVHATYRPELYATGCGDMAIGYFMSEEGDIFCFSCEYLSCSSCQYTGRVSHSIASYNSCHSDSIAQYGMIVLIIHSGHYSGDILNADPTYMSVF